MAIVKDIAVRKAPLFFGLVYSPIRTGPSEELIPMARPWRNLAMRSIVILVARMMQNQPIIMGAKLARLAVLLPYLAIIVGTMKMPATRANPRIAAEIKYSKISQVIQNWIWIG